MYRIIVVLALVISLFHAVAQAEETSHVRLLLHGTNTPDSSNIGVAGWVVAPNLTSSPSTWLAVVGPKFASQDTAGVWKSTWIEIMTGAIIEDGARTELIDIRAKFPNFFGITPWTNLQWVNFSEGFNGVFYAYFELKRAIIKNILMFGLETENTFKPNAKDDLSVGIHANFSLGAFNIIPAFQWHKNTPNQFWFRVLINL
jgi:hypothetical protein